MFGPELRATVQETLWAREISQRDLARTVGLTEGAISRFLSGERETSFETIDKLMDALGLEIVIRPRRHSRKDG
jgi:transcriptional regulator with XRE-family HTH domain